MAGFEEQKPELDKLGVKVFAASVDSGEQAREVQSEVSFTIGQGVTRDMADQLGSWWEDRRGLIQPSEFVLGFDGKIIHSSYSSGALARTDAGDLVLLLNFLESRK